MVQENDWAYFAKELIWTLTSESGWDGAENEDQTDVPLYSTKHTNWLAPDPESIAWGLQKGLQEILASAEGGPDL